MTGCDEVNRRSFTGYPASYNGDIIENLEWVGQDSDGNLERVESCVRGLSLIIYDGMNCGLEYFPEAVQPVSD